MNLNGTQDGPLLVDVAILGPCPAIALQIEDPGELAVNAPWLPLGNTRLKQQTIRSKGWQVCIQQIACNIYTYLHNQQHAMTILHRSLQGCLCTMSMYQ